jgi:DNA-binding MarR family transcriptional regulator
LVKRLDEKSQELPDHVGWRLWNASRAWQADFAAAMRGAGHPWFTEARATLLGHLARKGTRQSDLIERMAISKQAVQQLLDGLEAEGVVARLPDPQDGRAKLVCYTQKGLAALRDGDHIKREIERRYIARLGPARFASLMDALRALDERRSESTGENADASHEDPESK